MQRETLTIISQRRLNSSVYEMKLAGCSSEQQPGQFVDIALDGLFLRRPISVCDWSSDALTLVYKVVGKGTAAMAAMQPAGKLDVLCGLGHGFDLDVKSCKPVLIGGGIGAAPLYLLARKLLERGVKPSVVLGFNTASEIVIAERMRDLGLDIAITTADGSEGIRGFVTDALPLIDHDFYYACGPLPMLKALSSAARVKGQLSLEERMGCGTGICMGCSCKTLLGPKRICKDGPVFNSDEIDFGI